MDMKCLYSHIHKRLGVNIELIIQEIRCLIITHDMTATYSKVFESMGYTLDGYSIVLLYRTPDWIIIVPCFYSQPLFIWHWLYLFNYVG